MESANDFLGSNVLIEVCRLVFQCDSDCHLFIHCCFKCDEKLNRIYHIWKKLELKTLNIFKNFYFFWLFEIQIMKSRDHCWIHIWLRWCLDSDYLAFAFCFCIFFFSMHFALGDNYHCSCTVHVLFMGSTTTLFRKKY